MGGRYYLTGVQLGILIANTDEKIRMDILNKIMNDQYLGEKGDFVNLFEELNDDKDNNQNQKQNVQEGANNSSTLRTTQTASSDTDALRKPMLDMATPLDGRRLKSELNNGSENKPKTK